MKRAQLCICMLVALGAFGCKTQEDIRRERTVETLNEEIQQTKKSTASGNSRFTAIEDQVAQLNGKVEEIAHNRSQSSKEIQTLQERISTLEETNAKQVEYIKALTEKVNNQSDYIEEVIASLAKLSDKAEVKPSGKKKALNTSKDEQGEGPATFAQGLKKYRSNDLQDAKEIFEQISQDKKAKKKDREGSIHYLGMIEYKNKKYEAAKVYFSKLFSESPASSFAPTSLLYLAKTFSQLKMPDESSMTLDELKARFPKSKEAAEAAKLKK